jgi:hypothetical protein
VTGFLTILAAVVLALPRSVKFEGFSDRGKRHRRLDAGSGGQTITNGTSIGG